MQFRVRYLWLSLEPLLLCLRSPFRAFPALLTSGSTFANSFTTLFSPIGSSEYDLTSRHPQAEVTVNNIGQYQTLMEDLRETLAPELELIDSRVITPSLELQDICKRIRKTITKRDHKVSR